jgi:hypothetical protein
LYVFLFFIIFSPFCSFESLDNFMAAILKFRILHHRS